MWNRLAEGIIKYRLPLIVIIGLITVFMGFKASQVQMSYDFARTVPPEDPDMIMFERFKAQFGEELIGLADAESRSFYIQDSSLFVANEVCLHISGYPVTVKPFLTTLRQVEIHDPNHHIH